MQEHMQPVYVFAGVAGTSRDVHGVGVYGCMIVFCRSMVHTLVCMGLCAVARAVATSKHVPAPGACVRVLVRAYMHACVRVCARAHAGSMCSVHATTYACIPVLAKAGEGAVCASTFRLHDWPVLFWLLIKPPPAPAIAPKSFHAASKPSLLHQRLCA